VTASEGCRAHAGVGEELRVLVLTALERIDPLLDRMRSEPAGDAPEGCASCPVCAVLAALRGERPELAVRLAEHAAGLVAVLRAALEDGTAAPAAAATAATTGRPARHVQRIRVERQAR
jgi:hypothetical protein